MIGVLWLVLLLTFWLGIRARRRALEEMEDLDRRFDEAEAIVSGCQVIEEATRLVIEAEQRANGGDE